MDILFIGPDFLLPPGAGVGGMLLGSIFCTGFMFNCRVALLGAYCPLLGLYSYFYRYSEKEPSLIGLLDSGIDYAGAFTSSSFGGSTTFTGSGCSSFLTIAIVTCFGSSASGGSISFDGGASNCFNTLLNFLTAFYL